MIGKRGLLLALGVGFLCGDAALLGQDGRPQPDLVPTDVARRQPVSPPTKEQVKLWARANEQKILLKQPVADPNSRRRTLLTTDFLVQDPCHHLWAFMVDGKKFSEWDGISWQERPVPDDVLEQNVQSSQFVADAHGQAWLWPLDAGPTSVFEFATGRWQVFETLREAVAARLVPGDCLAGSMDVMPVPASHLNGTKALMHVDGRIEVLRAGAWHSTTVAEVSGAEGGTSDPLTFTHGGDLCFQVNEKYYAFGQENSWGEVPSKATLPGMDRYSSPATPRQIPGIANVRSSIWDRTGAAWIVAGDRHLHKWREGRSVAIMDGEKPLVMPDTSFCYVLIDPVGNAFIRHCQWGAVGSYEFVAALPGTSGGAATLGTGKGGLVNIKLPDQAQGWRRWRNDGASWSDLTRELLITPKGLLPGTHHLEMAAFDDEFTLLEPSQKWEIKIDALVPDDLRQWIQLLGSPDLGRGEEAAQILVNQGPEALPALERALQEGSAEESRQWWLRAVIQRIKRESVGKG
jgi:hypothetical protein